STTETAEGLTGTTFYSKPAISQDIAGLQGILRAVDSESSRALPSWASLLVRSREGDEIAFEELVRACERRVLSIAYQITGNLEDAQDVAQDSFLRVYRSRDRFQDGRSFEAWL